MDSDTPTDAAMDIVERLLIEVGPNRNTGLIDKDLLAAAASVIARLSSMQAHPSNQPPAPGPGRRTNAALRYARQYRPSGAASPFEGEQATMAEVIALLAEEVDRLRSLFVVPAVGRVIPEALGDEDGEHWWIPGHVAPSMAVLAVVVEQMVNVDADQAMGTLVGWQRDDPGQLDIADRLVRSVQHVWVKDDPEHADRWQPAEPGEEGAEAWTEVAL